MSRVLAELLGVSEPELSGILLSLEEASGGPGVDIRLIAELSATVHQKTRELGLDPKDTTGRELYHALQALVAQHDMFLAQVLGARDSQNVKDVLPRIISAIQTLPIPRKCWAIKPSVIKKLLKKTPPKKVMKQLGYRSVDSMIKREATDEILGATRVLESLQWQHRFTKTYKQLSPSDFETRDIVIKQLDTAKWGSAVNTYIYAHHHNITHLKEFGSVLVLPLPVLTMPGLCVTLLPMILHYINEIRIYSSYFKLEQVKPHFGEIVAKTISEDPTEAANMAGQKIHWRTLSKHFGKAQRPHPDEFQPHVQADDLYYRKAEDVVYRLEPALKFWENLDYVARSQAGVHPVSLSLLDNAVSYCNGLEYGQNILSHSQTSLWNELLLRYMDQESLEEQVLNQLSDDLVHREQVGAV